jgi:Ca2+-binding RTX toxin-like protein
MISLFGVAPASAADAECVYDDAAKTITYALPASGSVPLVQRAGNEAKEIFIGTEGGTSADLCKDPQSDVHARVDNTDTITLTGNPLPNVGGQDPRLEFGFGNGRLEPGATPEADGSEIEVLVPEVTGQFQIAQGRADKQGTFAGNDRTLAGKKGINFNSDEMTKDLDVVVGSGAGGLTGVRIYGGLGNDIISIVGDEPAGGPIGVVGATLTHSNNLRGQEGNDELDLTGTPDSFSSVSGGTGDDVIKGSGNRNFSATSMNYSDATEPIKIDLSLTTPQEISPEQGTDTITGVYAVAGTTGADTITGDAGNNTLSGDTFGSASDGVDTIHGGGGGDSIGGGAGADHLFGEGDIDGLNGGPGADDLHGGDGNDSLEGDGSSGTPAADQMFGDAGDDKLELDRGDDSLSGGEGSDEIQSYDATGAIVIDLTQATTTNPGTGTDSIAAMENVSGTDFDDVVNGNESANKIVAAEHVEGRGGDDTIFSLTDPGEFAEIDGGAGSDKIYGGEDADTLLGGPGADNIIGFEGDDTISAPADGEKDTVSCGDDTDTVTSYDEGLDALTACESSTPGTPGGGGTPETPAGGSAQAGTGSAPAGSTGSQPKKPLKCRKGFKKVKVKGKQVCKRKKKRRRG